MILETPLPSSATPKDGHFLVMEPPKTRNPRFPAGAVRAGARSEASAGPADRRPPTRGER
jgi:hypothetical protein